MRIEMCNYRAIPKDKKFEGLITNLEKV